jgi:hypothetical protein
MNKTFFALIAALPFIAGCWPFSKEEKKQEVTENVMPAAEEMNNESVASTSDASETSDVLGTSEAESDEK